MDKDVRVLPTHIIAAAGIVINEKDEVLMVKANHDGCPDSVKAAAFSHREAPRNC